MDRTRLKDTLRRHEGVARTPYMDTEGKMTVGVGRNLTDRGLADDEIEYLFDNDIEIALAIARRIIPRFDGLSALRQEAFVNMAFNLGEPRLARFTKMREAAAEDDWPRVGAEALDSRWAEQVGRRAREIAYILEHDEVPDDLD